jgi:hypothetical protein
LHLERFLPLAHWIPSHATTKGVKLGTRASFARVRRPAGRAPGVRQAWSLQGPSLPSSPKSPAPLLGSFIRLGQQNKLAQALNFLLLPSLPSLPSGSLSHNPLTNSNRTLLSSAGKWQHLPLFLPSQPGPSPTGKVCCVRKNKELMTVVYLSWRFYCRCTCDKHFL